MSQVRTATIRQLIETGATELRDSKSGAAESPRREASLILQAVLGLDRAQVLARSNEVTGQLETDRYWEMVHERARGVPLQILVGETEFHEVMLRVESGVFIPRPETELLVEEARSAIERLVKEKGAGRRVRVLDLGTGTGAIAVALAVSFRDSGGVSVYAGEWNPQAVRLARHNAERNAVSGRLEVRRSNLFSAFADLECRVDVLVSNPPYIAPEESESLPLEVRIGDPKEALFDSEGGTGFHRKIASRGRDFLVPNGLVMLEIGETQGEEVATILEELGYTGIRVLQDLTKRDRFALGRWMGKGAGSSGRADSWMRSS